MIPVQCRVSHKPDQAQYGDCVRACIASIMELDAEQVPHFYEDNCAPAEGMRRIRKFLHEYKCTAFVTNYPPVPMADVLEVMGELNPDAVYMLFGSTGDGDHVVVCEGGKVAHNPAWYGCSLVEHASHGAWQVLVIARV